MNKLTNRGIVILIVVSGFLLHLNCLAQEPNRLVMVWWDEFNYSGAPDTSKWGYDVGGWGWGNNEEQYYTDQLKNSYVENGDLHIEALKENDSWTSARLITKNKGDWLYGRIEVRANLPSGRGTWPAIWMLPTDWEYGDWPSSGEIDIMEHVGYEPTTVYGTVHTEAYNHGLGTQRGDDLQVPDAEREFTAACTLSRNA
ncbi:MAG: glycoside hydrolase family 16 protein [Bacteroidetes bacterium]|nr:glycoside hydrolase family 16 protein [Bacteroidota bacterium]